MTQFDEGNCGNILGIQKGTNSMVLTIEIWRPIESEIRLGYCKVSCETE